MACGICNSQSKYVPLLGKATSVVVDDSCPYTLDMMEVWKTRLKCVKTNGLYDEIQTTETEINSALGIVQSAINTKWACKFAQYLDEINNIILRIINTGKC